MLYHRKFTHAALSASSDFASAPASTTYRRLGGQLPTTIIPCTYLNNRVCPAELQTTYSHHDSSDPICAFLNIAS